jgi:DnaJ-class molecular chaperone
MIETQNPATCPLCLGEGEIICPRCKSAGFIIQRYFDLTAGDAERRETCNLCEGKGKIPCPQCQI